MDFDSEPITIASAVVLPTDDDAATSPAVTRVSPSSPPSTKRRAASPLSPTSKRARTSRSRSPSTQRPAPPPARRPSGPSVDEEKKRGKRLFGALLGTIGQFKKETATQRARTSAVKRMEVEEKMKEKLKAQSEELDEKRKRELEIAGWRKRRERRRWEERVARCRHENERCRAAMLKTMAGPELYYLPWKLLPSEEDTIAAQLTETDERIEREEREMQDLRDRDDEEMRAAGITLEDVAEDEPPAHEDDDDDDHHHHRRDIEMDTDHAAIAAAAEDGERGAWRSNRAAAAGSAANETDVPSNHQTPPATGDAMDQDGQVGRDMEKNGTGEDGDGTSGRTTDAMDDTTTTTTTTTTTAAAETGMEPATQAPAVQGTPIEEEAKEPVVHIGEDEDQVIYD